MGKQWIIPAPEWDGGLNYYSGDRYFLNKEIVIGEVYYHSDDDTWLAFVDSNEPLSFSTETEARAWVEQEVMKALGAKVLK